MAMTAVVTDTIPKTQDDNYHNIFFTEWNVNYGDVLDIGVEEDCDAGKDDIKVAEMIVGMATAPRSARTRIGTSTRPRLVSRPRSAPKLFAFKFAASQDFRRYGHSQRLNEYPVKQAQILLNTVKIRFYNLLNNAFSSSYPLAYDAGGSSSPPTIRFGAAASAPTSSRPRRIFSEDTPRRRPASPRRSTRTGTFAHLAAEARHVDVSSGDSVRYLESALTVDQLTAALADVQASVTPSTPSTASTTSRRTTTPHPWTPTRCSSSVSEPADGSLRRPGAPGPHAVPRDKGNQAGVAVPDEDDHLREDVARIVGTAGRDLCRCSSTGRAGTLALDERPRLSRRPASFTLRTLQDAVLSTLHSVLR